jgi:hypothetical protein
MTSETSHSAEISFTADRLGADSLVLSPNGIASLFRKSKSWFYLHRQELEEAGFPTRDPLLGGWSATAVFEWFDLRNRERSRKRSPSATLSRGLRGQEYSGAHLD